MPEEKVRCIAKVWDGWHSHRCTKPVWKDDFCKIHHPDKVKEREAKSNARYEEKRKSSPFGLYLQLRDEKARMINELKLAMDVAKMNKDLDVLIWAIAEIIKNHEEKR